MLRNSADRRSIGLLIVILGLETSAIVFFDSMPMLLLVPVLFVLTIAVFTATLINHNHRHVATFDRPWANRIFNYVLSMAMGAPSTRLHMVHMLNHHKSYRTTEDWSHYSLAKDGRGLRRSLTYYLNATLRIGTKRKTLRMTAEDRQQLRIEYGFFFAWVFAWLTYDFSAAAIVLAIGYLGGQFILLIGNLINHDQCDLGSPYNLARNFHSRIENWIFLNHGYHTVHHRRTTLHWSKLRAVHDSHFRDKCDPALQNRSFLAYFFRHYLLS
jgi:fatty acid desaturase